MHMGGGGKLGDLTCESLESKKVHGHDIYFTLTRNAPLPHMLRTATFFGSRNGERWDMEEGDGFSLRKVCRIG